jgi:signal transduction histidine kinase
MEANDYPGERQDSGRSEIQLHDDTIQALFGVGLRLEICQDLIEEAPDEARNALDSAINGLSLLIEEIRNRIESLDRRRAWSDDQWRTTPIR